MHIIVLLLAMTSVAAAQGLTLGSGQPREYPYPADPQYQYPDQRAVPQAQRKCPKGQASFQGRCRIIRPVYN